MSADGPIFQIVPVLTIALSLVLAIYLSTFFLRKKHYRLLHDDICLISADYFAYDYDTSKTYLGLHTHFLICCSLYMSHRKSLCLLVFCSHSEIRFIVCLPFWIWMCRNEGWTKHSNYLWNSVWLKRTDGFHWMSLKYKSPALRYTGCRTCDFRITSYMKI